MGSRRDLIRAYEAGYAAHARLVAASEAIRAAGAEGAGDLAEVLARNLAEVREIMDASSSESRALAVIDAELQRTREAWRGAMTRGETDEELRLRAVGAALRSIRQEIQG